MANIQELMILITDKDYASRKTKSISERTCVSCGKKADNFSDASTQFEYKISGLCEDCQKKLFGKSLST